MKKILMMAVALCALCACDNSDDPQIDPIPDAVSVAPSSTTVSSKGGEIPVIVTSSGEWTLVGSCDWATPSITEGEDGDIVKFTVETNKSDEDRSALFTFTRGEATASFTLTQKSGEPTVLELVSDSEVALTKEAAQVEVLLSTNINYRDLDCSIPESAREWLSHTITLAGDDGKGAKMVFSVTENTAFDGRSATVTISTPDEKSVNVTFTQAPVLYLNVSGNSYAVDLAGGKIEIPVETNVEYDVIVSTGDETWIVYKGLVDGKETFEIPAGEMYRRGTVAFKQKDGDISVQVDIIQKGNSLINVVADMTENWAWPEWNETTPVKDMKTFTFEALVCRTASKGVDKLSAIMGIEDVFLIRLGDVGVPEDQLQICFQKNLWSSAKLTNESMRLQNLNQWYHIAVTFENKKITAYIDGKEVGSVTTKMEAYDFSIAHNDESGKNPKRCFWVGYAFEGARYFPGYMSEVRIWNKCLTAKEINAGNHFYTVDTASEGLVSYWKFDDGKGSTIKDYAPYGNNLKVYKEMTWVPVALP